MKPINVYAYVGSKITSFVYIHGDLEEKCGTDLCYVANHPHIDGEYNVTVNGVHKAKMFLWNVPARQIGLVVSVRDRKGLAYARQMYNANADCV